ncbi:CHASE2 domain-containing protein [Saccharospirillum impatiens]|uniref:CHASE2 domain-containing protein n=1 Tax=Saccharospirillum impatiens TaxID=169438 RepID=UPI000426DDD4|nr:adenylate/guanylate cyclase domain-containing protein [Saccharospirillum impatiens]
MASPKSQYITPRVLRWGALLSGVLITLSLAGYHLFQGRYDQTSLIKRLDYILYDWRFNLFDSSKLFARSDANIVIVDIDESSLFAEGRWPWPRDKLATLTRQLTEAGAVVIGFDILMSEPQQNPTRRLQELARQSGETAMADALARFADLTEYDQQLADAFANVDVVTPFLFHENAATRSGQLPPPVYSLSSDQADRLLAVQANGYTGALPILQRAAVGAGFIVPAIDGDGVLRSAPLVTQFDGALYPSLSLSMGLAYYLLDDIDLSVARYNDQLDIINWLQFADQRIRTDVAGRVLIPYLGGQGQFPYLSATDVLNQRIDTTVLENALVLVGTSSVGLADLRTTPVGTQFPGVEIHATLLNALLAGDFPYTPDVAHSLTALILLILGIIYSTISSRVGPMGLVFATLVLLAVMIGVNFYFWQYQKVALPLASSLLLTISLGGLHLLQGFLGERRTKQHISSVFGQYVPQAHIDHMLAHPNEYGFAGENREMTVLFSDIRSFTTISESLDATELKDLLNRYFTPITESIFNHQGTIDKYVGDMVMAFWGAPLKDPLHARHALEAAMDMIDTLAVLNPELNDLGYPSIDVGIGLNTGPMNVGDMGSHFRRAYTVLGDSVNLGARLEGLTKYYGVKILVGPATCSAIDDWVFRPVDRIRVKGKLEPVSVYEPISRKAAVSIEWQQELALWATTYQNYLNRDWVLTRQQLLELSSLSDRPRLYQVYLDRLTELETEGVPPDWDGTYTHTSK